MTSQPNWDLSIEVENINRSRPTARITVDKMMSARIVERTQPYKNLPRMFRPVLEEIADYVRNEMIPEVFEQEGPNWRPLAPRTVAERIAAGFPGQHPILQRTGDLFQELTRKSHPKHVEIVKVGKNSRIEIGGSSKKFIDNQLGLRAAHLPARPMIPGTGEAPISNKHRIEIVRILEKVKRRARV